MFAYKLFIIIDRLKKWKMTKIMDIERNNMFNLKDNQHLQDKLSTNELNKV